MENKVAYVALCLTVPLLWGVLAARAFDWWQGRRRATAPRDRVEDGSVDMYYI